MKNWVESGKKTAHRMKRFICVLVCLLLLPFIPVPSLGEVYAADGTVRVYLSSLNSPLSVQLTVCGTYYVNNDASDALENGSTAMVKINSSTGKLTLVTDRGQRQMGTSFTLFRKDVKEGTGLKIAQARKPGNLYPADFTFSAVSDSGSYKLYVVASVAMEDYLCGVVPYEIGDGSSLEALKAQAVVGRTYVMRKKSGTAGRIYDVVDTPTDQVYNGTYSGYANTKRAVFATAGEVLMYNGGFAATFCTSSNGGQTEAAKNAWGGTGYDYLSVRDDPYDLASNARKVSFAVNSGAKQSNSTLNTLLNNKLKNVYGSNAVLTGIYDLELSEPRYAGPSRLYTKLTFCITYSVNGSVRYGKLTFGIFDELEGKLGMSLNSGSNELWYTEQSSSGWTVTARRVGHGIGLSQYGAIKRAESGQSYREILAFYFPGCDHVTFTLTGRGAAVGETQTDSLSARVNTVSGSLNLRNGASTSAAVLCEIPKHTVIEIFDAGEEWCFISYKGQYGYVMTKYLVFDSATLQPAQTPASTPAPTAAPGPAEEIESRGRVNTASSSLNLCKSPSGSVIGSIPKGTVIPLYEQTGDWYRTTYNGKSGFVSKAYIVLISQPPAPTAAPQATASPATPQAPVQQTAKVTTASGSLNLRSVASTSGKVLRTIPRGATVTVLEKGNSWSKVTYSGKTGYVMNTYLTFTSASVITAAPTPKTTPKPTAAPRVTDSPNPVVTPAPAPADIPVSDSLYAVVVTSGGTLNLRSAPGTNAKVLYEIPFCSRVSVQEKGTLWSLVRFNGYTGYVMTSYLAFENGAVTDADVPAPAGLREAGMRTLENPVYATVASSSGSLNLRSGCSTAYSVLLEIPRYARVTVTAVSRNWCEVYYEGHSGFCMRKYISFAE